MYNSHAHTKNLLKSGLWSNPHAKTATKGVLSWARILHSIIALTVYRLRKLLQLLGSGFNLMLWQCQIDIISQMRLLIMLGDIEGRVSFSKQKTYDSVSWVFWPDWLIENIGF